MSNEKPPVVLLAAGEGTRLQPLSEKIIKPLVPIAGIPIIERIINIFQENGFKNFIIVIGNGESKLQTYLDKTKMVKSGIINIKYVIQAEPKGMADAIAMTENHVKQTYNASDFFVSASDVIFENSTPNDIHNKHLQTKSKATLSLLRSPDDKMADGHGNVQIQNEKITKIVEKPGADKKISDYYSMPLYLFSTDLFKYLKSVDESERGELEVQDAIQQMIVDGLNIIGIDLYPNKEKGITLTDISKYHLTYVEDVLAMTFRFLGAETVQFDGEWPATLEPITTEGVVKSGDSLLLGPNVYLGKNCILEDLVEISNSILIGNNIIGKSTSIDNCIITEGVNIEPNQKLKNKLILNDKLKHDLF